MDWEPVGAYCWRQEIGSWDPSTEPPRPLYTVYIQGAAGAVAAKGIIWIQGREDLLATVYWEIVAVLDGHYHCCLSGNCWSLM
jgi:hypothetical protein